MTEIEYQYSKSLSKRAQQELYLSERQLAVADLYFRKHLSAEKIAIQLGVHINTVYNDKAKILKEYQMKRLEKVQTYLNMMDLQLNAVEREAWDAWERSIGKNTKKVRKSNSDGEWEEIITETELVGDPRFLTIILSAQDRRIRIFGLDQPKEIIISTLEQKLTKGIIEGRITFDMLVNDVGKDQARRYFNLAGVEVPDIVEGEYVDTVEVQDKPEDILEVLDIPEYTVQEETDLGGNNA